MFPSRPRSLSRRKSKSDKNISIIDQRLNRFFILRRNSNADKWAHHNWFCPRNNNSQSLSHQGKAICLTLVWRRHRGVKPLRIRGIGMRSAVERKNSNDYWHPQMAFYWLEEEIRDLFSGRQFIGAECCHPDNEQVEDVNWMHWNEKKKRH